MPTRHAPEFVGRSNSMLEQTRHQPSNPFPTLSSLIVLFLLGIFPPTICLIETTSIKSYEVIGYKEVVMPAQRDDERVTSKGHTNNEHTASRQHGLLQTRLECNTQDIPVIVVESLDAEKGSGKGLREGKHMIPRTPPTVSSLPYRKMKCGVFNLRTSRTNRVISGENKLIFGIEENIKSLDLDHVSM